MCSASFVDFLAEKIFSFSSKMRDDSFQLCGTSFLMNGGNKNSHQWDPLRAVSVFKENVLDFEASNPLHPNDVLGQILSILDSNHNIMFPHSLGKPEYLFSHAKNGLFSSHLLNLINLLNTYHYRNTHADMSLLPYSSIFSGNMINSLFSESPEMKKTSTADLDKKTCDSPVSKFIIENAKTIPDIKETLSSPIKEFTMSVSISQIPTNKTDLADEQVDLSTNVKLNLKLSNRKTKQMNKRSKKRRRRQKKSGHPVAGHSSALTGNGGTHVCQFPVSNSVSLIAESPGCKISFQHSIKVPSCVSSFIVPDENNSTDDSDWEPYDEIDHYNPDSSTSDSEVFSSSNSSPVKLNTDCSVPKVKVASSIVSFVIPLSNSSDDDDSEWDTCEPEAFTETPDFEFTGLFLTNLCTPRTFSCNTSAKGTVFSDEETEESLQLKKVLLDVNKRWDNYTKGDVKPKSSSKVAFAPDEDLIEVFPIEMYERKGEWEMYATERLRFKRKIDELEKVLSPCLHPEHRAKIFKKLMGSEL